MKEPADRVAAHRRRGDRAHRRLATDRLLTGSSFPGAQFAVAAVAWTSQHDASRGVLSSPAC